MQYQKRRIAHLDLDAFFASVEIRDNPSLIGKPVIIGSKPPARGVVSTCSYEARKFGVRSGMPVKTAQILCPNAIFIKPDISKYVNQSKGIFEILKNFSSCIEKVGIDEGYLDLTGMVPLYESYEKLVKAIKDAIFDKFKLTCSIGLSSSKLISKIASDRCKPDGMLILGPEEEEDFLMASPVQTIPFFGKKTISILESLGIKYFKEIYNYDLSFLIKKLGSFIEYFYLKRFLDEGIKEEKSETKSFSTETTFEQDIDFTEDIFNLISNFAEELAQKLRDEGYKATTISAKVRDEDFETYQKQTSIKEATFNENDIANIAYKNVENIMKSKIKDKRIRLIGIKVSGLIKDSSNLFDMIGKDDIIYNKIDELNKKFGKLVVKKGIVWRKKDY
jgi:nucleotidyltransferase/DNA polymerase involved in DNA repair